jgi:mannose-6-phosphate isomerase-like protein (cupin superfamily)
MIIHDLSAGAVSRMPRVNLESLDHEPPSPTGSFEFNGCTCGIASFIGTPPWELHTQGDEILQVLSGEVHLTVREPGADTSRTVRTGELVVVPRGCWHRNLAPDGVTMLFITPSIGNAHSWEDPDGV